MRWFGWFRKRQPTQKGAMQALELQDGAPVAMVAGRLRAVGLPYALPRDLEEVNRLDFQHYMLRYAFQGLYAAPIGQPARILDVGTGTGRWAREMAQLFPRAKVVGVDINPPTSDEQGPGVDLRPPNYSFQAGNVLEGLPIADGSYDFVHMRMLFTAIPADRWRQVVGELARVTRPGGWVESVETTGLHDGGPNVDLLMSWITQLSARRGVDLLRGAQVGEVMRGSGLGNVSASTVNLPTGAYGERLGGMLATDFISVCKGFAGVIVSAGLASQEQVDQTIEDMRSDFVNSPFRCYTPFYIAYGQRPG
jgi:SAM-dependent methyltransferase